jgi:hypothetical protein
MSNNTTTKLTRRQVAALLGILESEVKAKDGDAFHPTKGKDGSWLYSVDEVVVAVRGGDTTVDTGTTGAVFARAFELFKEGKTLSEVVIALQQVPETVRSIRAEFDVMEGCMVISSTTVALIEGASLSRVRDETQLLGLIERLRIERDTAYQEGQADAGDMGEVLDRCTGKMVSVGANGAAAGPRQRPVEANCVEAQKGR